MKTPKLLLLVGLTILQATTPLSVFAQKDNLKFQHLGNNQGLSQSNVLNIFQDSRGFMWFGTEDGLNRFDGYTIKVFRKDLKNNNSISANWIIDIDEDSKGNLWIATSGGGLNKYDRELETFTRYRHDKNNPSSIRTDYLTSVKEDSNGNLWVGTEKFGLALFDREKNQFMYFDVADSTFTDNTVGKIIEGGNRNL